MPYGYRDNREISQQSAQGFGMKLTPASMRKMERLGGFHVQAELERALDEATSGLVGDLRDAVMSVPTKGGEGTGLRTRIAGAITRSFKVTNQRVSVTLGVSVSDRDAAGLAPLTEGKKAWRHPAWGRDDWYPQDPWAGGNWFLRTCQRVQPMLEDKFRMIFQRLMMVATRDF